jgi:NAD(P)H-hydrate epimerase
MVTPESLDLPLPSLPSRPADGHKGTFGRVLIVAGALGMSGAAALSGEAALRSGSGLVYVATAESIVPVVGSLVRELVLIDGHEAPEGHLSAMAVHAIMERAGKCDAAAIGPGLGTAEGTRRLVHLLVQRLQLPLVIDADGLNNLAGHTELIETRKHPTILTPHPGEFIRLSGEKEPPGSSHRATAACRLSRRLNAVVLLKGRETVIAAGNRYVVNRTGNSGMATAGTGDVLTGMIVSFLGQGRTPLEAAWLAAHLHGRAGDLAAEDLGEHSVIAGDVLRKIPAAFKALAEEHDSKTIT